MIKLSSLMETRRMGGFPGCSHARRDRTPGSDTWAVREGWAAVTPLGLRCDLAFGKARPASCSSGFLKPWQARPPAPVTPLGLRCELAFGKVCSAMHCVVTQT